MTESATGFAVHIEPGGHDITVRADENVLTAALAAGIPIPYSCRAGRCASCKSKLVAGTIEYPHGITPPGVTPAEVARGDVLLCQAQPRSDLSLEVRRVPVRAANAALCELFAIEPLSFGALRLRLRYVDVALTLRPGQFVDVRNHAGDAERLPVVATGSGVLELESPRDGSVLHEWLSEHAVPGSQLRVSGPFDRPR